MARFKGRRLAAGVGTVAALAAALITFGALAGHPPADKTLNSPVGSGGNTGGSSDPLAKDIQRKQLRLQAVAGDWTAWAGLAADYVQEARITANPTYYPKADGAIARSFQIYPKGNFLALTVEATVAAARHDFAGALRLADAALNIDSYNTTAYGIRGDALNELGRYDEALKAFTQMDHLRPSLSSFSRLSYSYELRGNLKLAEYDLQLALNDSVSSSSDTAFAAYYLGELAWNHGDLTKAEHYYRLGKSLDPNYVPPLEGIAKVEVAQGQTDAAIRDYQQVTNQLPLPQYVTSTAIT
jgi:tetratricopeptide (TPR) repeat protein